VLSSANPSDLEVSNEHSLFFYCHQYQIQEQVAVHTVGAQSKKKLQILIIEQSSISKSSIYCAEFNSIGEDAFPCA
jgi:hypothetical protein